MTESAAEARDRALERVAAHANANWMVAARYAVRRVAELDQVHDHGFTTDDVWDMLRAKWPALTTHEPRAMGVVMRDLAKAGVIVKTGATRKSGSAVNHKRDLAVWRHVARFPVAAAVEREGNGANHSPGSVPRAGEVARVRCDSPDCACPCHRAVVDLP